MEKSHPSKAGCLTAAIIGFGRNGESMHAKPLHASADFRLAAVADVNPDRAETARSLYGAEFFEDYLEMLDATAPDLVSIVSRSDQHVEMACACLERGCAVLVTKPWSLDAAGARRMIEAANRHGALLLPWLPARWAPDLERISALVREGVLGEVFHVRRTVTAFRRRDDWQTLQRYGGGYLLNWGPHIIEPSYRILGTRVEEVASAELRRVINGGDTEDHFRCELRLANGAGVTAEHTISPLPLPSWIVQGDKGSLVARGNRLEWSFLPAGENPPPEGDGPRAAWEDVQGPIYGDVHRVYADAARVLRGEKVANFDTASALHLSEVLDAVRAAADAKVPVRLPGLPEPNLS